MKKILIKLLIIPLAFVSCENLFEPPMENIRDLSSIYDDPTFADGILGSAYILLPYQSSPTSDVATDDAVTNDLDNSYLKMVTGTWSSNSNPTSQWDGRKAAIMHLNGFLAEADNVTWVEDTRLNEVYNDRLKGEAYAMRALQMYYLLQAHAGKNSAGQVLGVPVITSPEEFETDHNRPRNTFQECVDAIMSDLDMATELLPLDFADIASDSEIPAKYQGEGLPFDQYNRANGVRASGRITGRIAEAIRAQVALLAASPAFEGGSDLEWSDAAVHAATVLNRIGGVNGIDNQGNKWYLNDGNYIDGLTGGQNPAEIIWRSNIETNNTLEAANFPPSLRGTGRINPTQNLVDAFPDVNGYPIDDASTSYDEANPYANRDPRLNEYVVLNGSTLGVDGTQIITGVYGTNDDALNAESGYSTRTGYYMRKLLRPDTNPNPSVNTQQKHFTARIRYTEIFLAYAEAANEAYGPTGTAPGAAYSAYDVLKAIRSRAGIANGDQYLESIKSDQDKMRELIRNERRLELCFENKRFWDLRRWLVDLDKLNETAVGVEISEVGGVQTYNEIDVDKRVYKDYMYYGPIPYSEMLKYDQLEQNKGW